MLSRFVRSAARGGWRGVVLLGLVPVAAVSFIAALTTSGIVHAAAYGVYLTVAMVMLVVGWRLAFNRRGGAS